MVRASAKTPRPMRWPAFEAEIVPHAVFAPAARRAASVEHRRREGTCRVRSARPPIGGLKREGPRRRDRYSAMQEMMWLAAETIFPMASPDSSFDQAAFLHLLHFQQVRGI